MPWASDQRSADTDASERRIGLPHVEHRTLDPRQSSGPHRQVRTADLLAEIDRQIAVGIIVERFGQRADEKRLLGRTALLAEQPNGLDQRPCIERCALRGGRHKLRLGLRRRLNGTAKTLKRQLAVEQFGVSRRLLEVIIRLLELPGGERRASCPVAALGLHLERFAGVSISVEHGDRVPGLVHAIERDAPGEPGEARVIVADTDLLVADVAPGWKDIVQLGGDAERGLPLAVLRRVVRKQEQHVIEAVRVGRTVDEVVRAGAEVTGSLVEIVGAEITRSVHHQSGVRRH